MAAKAEETILFCSLCVKHGADKVDLKGLTADYEKITGQKLSTNAAGKRIRRLKEKLDKPSPKRRKTSDGVEKTEDKPGVD
jgi:hypothetical protein